jgi:Xaa-Pro aminopeptidase
MPISTTFIDRGDPGSGRFGLTSDTERDRRLAALREAMKREGLLALVVSGRSDLRFRGRVLYVSDIFQFTADCFVVLAMSGPPIFVSTPVVGLGQASRTNWVRDFRMSGKPGEAIGQLLIEHGLSDADIGIVGLRDAIAAAHLGEIQSAIPGARLSDATSLFESVRQVKSEEELDNLRHTSGIFRKMFGALEAEIRPGIQEADIAGNASRIAKLHGCRDVKTAMATTPFEAVSYGSPKRIERDTVVMVWIETPGPTGYWLELRRCYSFGRPPDKARRYWDVVEAFWHEGLGKMRPGANGSDVMESVGRILKKAGYSYSDSNYSIHGIGSDAIEGMWYPGNDRELKAGEVLSFHPAVIFPDPEEARQLSFLGMTDNVLVTDKGGLRLTYESDRIIEL